MSIKTLGLNFNLIPKKLYLFAKTKKSYKNLLTKANI